MWCIRVPAVQSEIVYPTCLKNTSDVYPEFWLAYFIYGSPSLQSVWLGKLYHLWFFWLLHGHRNVGAWHVQRNRPWMRRPDSGFWSQPRSPVYRWHRSPYKRFNSWLQFPPLRSGGAGLNDSWHPLTPCQHWSKWITWGQTRPFGSLVSTSSF